MKTVLACIAAVFGVFAISASASAAPQYVWVHYGDGEPFLYVTETPRPATVTTTSIKYSGVTFDSEVGVVCGAVRTRVDFDPFTSTLDSADRSAVAALAHCYTRGPMAGKTLNLVVAYDGTPQSEAQSYERVGQVMATLQSMGMYKSQLTYTKEIRPEWQANRITFRMVEPLPLVETISLEPQRCTIISPAN